MAIYDDFKKKSGVFAPKQPEAKPVKEGFFKSVGRALLPKPIENAVFGERKTEPLPSPTPQAGGSLYTQFRAGQGIFKRGEAAGERKAPAPVIAPEKPTGSLYGQFQGNTGRFGTTPSDLRTSTVPIAPGGGGNGFSTALDLFGKGIDAVKKGYGALKDVDRAIRDKTGGVIGISPIPLDYFDKVDAGVKELLNKPQVKEGIQVVAEATRNLPLKAYAVAYSLGRGEFEKRYDIYNQLITEAQKEYGRPDSPALQRLAFSVQNTAPQTAIGVLLTLGTTALAKNPAAGYSVGGAYWSALSADEQIQERGKIESLGNIAIDTVGDTLLGKYLEGLLGGSTASIRRGVMHYAKDVAKGGAVEGGTEVMQTLLKFSNDFKNAPDDATRQAVVEKAKQYVLNGDILIEFSSAAISGGLVSGGAIAASTVNVEQQGGMPAQKPTSKPEGKTLYDDFQNEKGAFSPPAEETPEQTAARAEEIIKQYAQEHPERAEDANFLLDKEAYATIGIEEKNDFKIKIGDRAETVLKDGEGNPAPEGVIVGMDRSGNQVNFTVLADKPEEGRPVTFGWTLSEKPKEKGGLSEVIAALPDAPQESYRVDTGFDLGKRAKAIEVVRFEESELGNDLQISDEVKKELQNVPASRLVWVTRTAEQATRYGEEVKPVNTAGGKVVADIGEDGVLVLLPEKKKAGKTQKEIVEEVVKERPKTIKEVATETGILEPNVRRILGVGEKEGTFERVAKGVYTLRVGGKEVAYVEANDAVDSLARMVEEGKQFDSVILDPAYFSRALIGGNRGIKQYQFISPPEFAKVMQSVALLVKAEDTHVYLMLSGARTAQGDMMKYVNGTVSAGFKPVGEGTYTKLTQAGEPVTNVRGEVAAPERLILLTLSGTAREGEIPTNLNFRFVRPSIAKSYQTEKPAALMRLLIRQSTVEGESVLDPFAGSGVTGAEAIRTGRKATLIEKQEKVVEERIKPRLEEAAKEIAEKPRRATPEETTTLKRTIADNEAKLHETYAAAAEAQGALDGIYAEMDIAEAGQRIFLRNDFGEDEVKGIPSTFPSWIPEELRLTKLFNKVLKGLVNVEGITYPSGRNSTRQRALYEAVLDELDSRLKVDTRELRRGIIEAYDALAGKIEIEEVAGRRAPGSERGGEIEPAEIFGDEEPLTARKAGGALGFNPINLEELESTAGKQEVEKITKRSDIARSIAEKLNVPIRRGKYRRPGAIGIYKPDVKVIRYKAGGLPTIFHETGHYIDDAISGFSGYLMKATGISKKEMQVRKAEREALMVNYGIKYEGQADRQASEAFAEFVRYYYTDRTKAQELAPTFFKFYEEKINELPEVKDVMEAASADYKRWLNMPATAKVFSQISMEETKPSVFERLKHTYHEIYESAIDDLHSIDQFSKLAKDRGVNFAAQEDPYVLARLFRGWVSKANTFLEKGTFGRVFWETQDGKTVPKFKHKSFAEIVRPIEEKGALDDFRTYLVSRRAVELAGRAIKTGIAKTDAQEAITELDGRFPEFEQAAKDLYQYNNDLLDYVAESGLIAEEHLAKMKELNQQYVPFFRVMEEMQSKGYMGKGFMNLANRIKKIRGSDREIIDPLESTVKNTYVLFNAAERNQIALAMARLSMKDKDLGRLMEHIDRPMQATQVNVAEVMEAFTKRMGIPLDIPQELREMTVNLFRPSTIRQDGVLTVMANGKPEFFYMDKDLYRGVQGLDVEQAGMIMKVLSFPAKFLRAGATLSPDFMVRNPFRDQWSALVYSKYGYIPGVDLTRGIFSLVGKDEAYWLWRMGGGEHSMLVSLDRQYLQKNLEQVLESKRAKALDYVKNPIEALRIVSELGEAGTRLGEAKKALKKGANPIEAAFAAREITLDFARIGTKTKAVNMLIAFWNANVQGTDKMIRSFKDNPIRTTTKVMLGMTLPSILLYFVNRDDDRWKEIPQWQKDLFWIVFVGDKIYRIPKPFEIGILFGSVPERVLEYIDNKDPKVFEDLKSAIGSGLTPGFIPTALLPVIENTANYNFFLGRNIVPEGKTELPQEAQYTEATSEVAKALGKGLDYSPAKIDNLIHGYFAGLGSYFVSGVDAVLKGTGITHGIERPATRVEDLPLLKAFMIKEPIGYNSQSVNRFYDVYLQASQGKRYYTGLLNDGRRDEAEAYLAEHPEIRIAPYYDAMARKFSDVRQIKDRVYNDSKLSADEKRTKLNELDRLMSEMAQKALEMHLKKEE